MTLDKVYGWQQSENEWILSRFPKEEVEAGKPKMIYESQQEAKNVAARRGIKIEWL